MKKIAFIIAALFLAMSGFFVARIPVRPELAGVSSVFVIFLALPSYVAMTRWLGLKTGLQVLFALGVYAVLLESFAVSTGIPYGHFVYGAKIGAKVLGLVPWTVPFAWTPLLLTSMALAYRWTTQAMPAIAFSAALLVALDLVLDPGAVAQQFWTWSQPSGFYGVPLSNFCGWFLTGAIGSWIFQRLTTQHQVEVLPPASLLGSGFLILSFWTSVCFWMTLWLPTFIGAALIAVIGFYLLGSQTPRPTSIASGRLS